MSIMTDTAETIDEGQGQSDLLATAQRGLAAIPKRWATPPAGTVHRKPVGKRDDSKPKSNCKECGGYHQTNFTHLDYMGHAEVTLALIDVDPEWNWRPAAIDPATGGPAIVRDGGNVIMWGYLTVLGVERMAVGTCEAGKSEATKELIGDLLRNGALRFGIGTRLWSKAEGVAAAEEPEVAPAPRKQTAPRAPAQVRDAALQDEAGHPPAPPASTPARAPGKATEAQVKKIQILLREINITKREVALELYRALGFKVESSKELAIADAGTVIEQLQALSDGLAELVTDPETGEITGVVTL